MEKSLQQIQWARKVLSLKSLMVRYLVMSRFPAFPAVEGFNTTSDLKSLLHDAINQIITSRVSIRSHEKLSHMGSRRQDPGNKYESYLELSIPAEWYTEALPFDKLRDVKSTKAVYCLGYEIIDELDDPYEYNPELNEQTIGDYYAERNTAIRLHRTLKPIYIPLPPPPRDARDAETDEQHCKMVSTSRFYGDRYGEKYTGLCTVNGQLVIASLDVEQRRAYTVDYTLSEPDWSAVRQMALCPYVDNPPQMLWQLRHQRLGLDAHRSNPFI